MKRPTEPCQSTTRSKNLAKTRRKPTRAEGAKKLRTIGLDARRKFHSDSSLSGQKNSRCRDVQSGSKVGALNIEMKLYAQNPKVRKSSRFERPNSKPFTLRLDGEPSVSRSDRRHRIGRAKKLCK